MFNFPFHLLLGERCERHCVEGNGAGNQQDGGDL